MPREPALPFYDQRKKMWAMKLGYRHTASGKRDRAWHYFPGSVSNQPPAAVITDATNKRREWQSIVEDWPRIGKMLAVLDPKHDYSMPVWFKSELYEGKDVAPSHSSPSVAQDEAKDNAERLRVVADAGDLETVLQELRTAGLLPRGILAPVRKPTIRKAMEEYLHSERKRIDLKIGDRIDIGTYNTNRNNLLLCLGCTVGKDWQQTVAVINLNKLLISLGNTELQAVANHWFALPGEVKSRRTVANYFAGFKAFLNWCELHEDFGFIKPKATNRILHIGGANKANVTAVDYASLRRSLADAPQQTRMYAMLALFCGFYQVDICELAVDEVKTIKGETYITGYRSKEDSENKEETKIMTTHWIPAEIAEVMRANKSKPNKWGLYFLNRQGQPMFAEKIEGGKRNSVSEAWRRVKEQHLSAPHFKQLRKWGWNEIMRFGSDSVCRGETLAARWAGQQGGGVAKFYRFQDYLPVIAAQRAWWKEVKRKVWM